jgi:hypothetical protein
MLKRVDDARETVKAWLNQLEGEDSTSIDHIIDLENLYYLYECLTLPKPLREQLVKDEVT